MSATVEVYVDSIRNLVAVAWPTRPGYLVYGDERDSRPRHVYVLPAGMTRLQEPPAVVTSCATTRQQPAVPQQPVEPGPRRVLAFGT